MRSARKWYHSLSVLVIGIGMLGMLAQAAFSYLLYQQTTKQFWDSLIAVKQEEVKSFSQLINRDIDAFYDQMHSLFSSDAYQRLYLSINERLYTSRYIQDAQYIWSDLSVRSVDLSYLQKIELYVPLPEKKVTSKSIVDYADNEQGLLEQIVQDRSGISYIDETVYFWTSKNYSKTGNLDAMGSIAVGTLGKNEMERYLYGYSTNSSSDILLFFWDDHQFQCISSLADLPASAIAAIGSAADAVVLQGSSPLNIQEESYLASWAQIGKTKLYLFEVSPQKMFSGQLLDFQKKMIPYQIVVLLLSLGFMVSLSLMVSRPMRQLNTALKAVEGENFHVRLEKTWTTEYQYTFDQFNRMNQKIQTLIEQEYALRLLNMKAQLKQLQYQINPHFLYNTYFSLRALLEEEDLERASRYVDVLGEYLKYITTSKQELGPLREEIIHAKSYAEIQQLRFQKRVRLEFEACPERLQDWLVPRLILQPLLENAYEHGVHHCLSNGLIRVSFEDYSSWLLIHVEDNGAALEDAVLLRLQQKLEQMPGNDAGDGIALVNIQKRLQLLYGAQGTLSVSRSPLGGLRATLRIEEEVKNVPSSYGG